MIVDMITPLPAKKAERRQNSGAQDEVKTETVEIRSGEPLNGSLNGPLPVASSIRTTSPGLTVYRGGAFVPRYAYTRQQLGGLKVDRQTVLLSLSYTPTAKLQLEA